MNQTGRQSYGMQNEQRLHVAFELSLKKWKLAMTDCLARRARIRTVDAGDLLAMSREIDLAIKKFDLPKDVKIVTCYEAGRDGWWLHRQLVQAGFDNVVVDPASVQTERHKRRAKTDRLDAEMLIRSLVRFHCGEERVWRVAHAPSIEDEDLRQVHRDLEQLGREARQHRCRIQSLLFAQGIREVKIDGEFLKWLAGSRLPPHIKSRLRREHERLDLVNDQKAQLETERDTMVAESSDRRLEKVRQLSTLKGIGTTSAWLFVMEFFGWRQFRNRKQVAGAAGLTPTPYDSGESSRDQGISKSGNHRVRHLAIEISWMWLRWQPQSELAQWFENSFGIGSKRSRRVGIVAMARRLLIDLWRYTEFGVVPQGAILKK